MAFLGAGVRRDGRVAALLCAWAGLGVVGRDAPLPPSEENSLPESTHAPWLSGGGAERLTPRLRLSQSCHLSCESLVRLGSNAPGQRRLHGAGVGPLNLATAAPLGPGRLQGLQKLAGHGPKGRAWAAPLRPHQPHQEPSGPNVRAGLLTGPTPALSSSSTERKMHHRMLIVVHALGQTGLKEMGTGPPAFRIIAWIWVEELVNAAGG